MAVHLSLRVALRPRKRVAGRPLSTRAGTDPSQRSCRWTFSVKHL